MSAPRSRWLRNARTPEVISSNRNGIVAQFQNFITGERVKVEIEWWKLDEFTKHIRTAGESEARSLERQAAAIRTNVGLPERKFAEGDPR